MFTASTLTSMALSEAIREIRRQLFTETSGARSWAPDLLIFIADRTATLAASNVLDEVRAAALDGISVYGLGVDSVSIDLIHGVSADDSGLKFTKTPITSLDSSLESMVCSNPKKGY